MRSSVFCGKFYDFYFQLLILSKQYYVEIGLPAREWEKRRVKTFFFSLSCIH